MGLFNFFKSNQPQITTPTNGTVTNGTETNRETPEIPRDLFIEDREPQQQPTMLNSNGEANGIEVVYAFLQADYEPRGYSDALTNADDSNKADAIKLIKHDLHILIQRVNNYYSKKIQDYDFHIASRGRAGLVDLVEELKSEKEKAEKDIAELNVIASQIASGTGMVERIIISYQKGFMRALSAITQSKILK
jgi:hypothetical protein